MNQIHLLAQDERELFFLTAADIQNMPFEIIEKDFWVVWILGKLFSLGKVSSYLTFKGGTSLSKVYRLIDRFSEDIDLSIERDFFGFGIPNNPENAPSKKKQNLIIENLSQACTNYVQNELLNELKNAISAKLGTNKGWQLFADSAEPDSKTLLYEYQSKKSNVEYIRPIVKIEIGARSEHWPVSDHIIHSYTKEALKEKIYEPETKIRVLNAERTFWEKATILHQYVHLPADKMLPPRVSRHFYDFFRLLNSPIKKKALEESILLERVANHKSIYFASGWASYSTARQGTLKLVPPPRILKDLQKDYALMKSMLFREVPAWELILKTIREFENEFNNPNRNY